MKKISFGIATASALFALAAAAQNATPPRSDMPSAAAKATTSSSMQFGTVDQNKDGRISRAEATSHGAELGGAFATLDADSDTYLSQAEFGKYTAKKTGAMDGAKSQSHDHDPGRAMPGTTPAPAPAGQSGTRTPATGQ